MDGNMIDLAHPVIRQVLTLRPMQRQPDHLVQLLQVLDAGILESKPLPPRD